VQLAVKKDVSLKVKTQKHIGRVTLCNQEHKTVGRCVRLKNKPSATPHPNPPPEGEGDLVILKPEFENLW
jgi:hypothetical protein